MVQNRFAVLVGFLLIASAVFAQQNDVAVSFRRDVFSGRKRAADL